MENLKLPRLGDKVNFYPGEREEDDYKKFPFISGEVVKISDDPQMIIIKIYPGGLSENFRGPVHYKNSYFVSQFDKGEVSYWDWPD